MKLLRERIAGVVLCGGESRRFGSSKPHYVLEGTTLAQRAVDTLSKVTENVMISVGANQNMDWPAATIVVDQYQGVGPIAGIQAALTSSEADWLIVIAADLAFIDETSIQKLVKALDAETEALIAIDPSGRMHPTCGVYSRSLLAMVEDSIRRGQYSLKGLINGLETVRFVTLADTVLRNINRPEDLSSSKS